MRGVWFSTPSLKVAIVVSACSIAHPIIKPVVGDQLLPSQSTRSGHGDDGID